jgi:hypothetical protein
MNKMSCRMRKMDKVENKQLNYFIVTKEIL